MCQLDDETVFRCSFDLVRRSRTRGNHPFGALLINFASEVLIEAENGFLPDRNMTGPNVFSRRRPAPQTEPCVSHLGGLRASRWLLISGSKVRVIVRPPIKSISNIIFRQSAWYLLPPLVGTICVSSANGIHPSSNAFASVAGMFLPPTIAPIGSRWRSFCFSSHFCLVSKDDPHRTSVGGTRAKISRSTK